MKNFAIVVLPALLAVLSFAGCSQRHQKKSQAKTIRLVARDNIKSGDPASSYDSVSLDIVSQIYEGLYQYNYQGKPHELVPLLADGWPKVSSDRRTYTFKLKKGIRYQDDVSFHATGGKGREVVAQDFIYAWKRHANPTLESQGFWIWDKKILGMDEYRKKFENRPQGMSADEIMDETIEGMRALDSHTIQLSFIEPYPQILYILTMVFTAPLPEESVRYYGKDFVNHPIGTGPFRVERWHPTSRVILVRNENFHDEYFLGKKLPLSDRIEFEILKEDQPRWLKFLAGQVDQIEIPKDNFDSAIEKSSGLANELKPDLKNRGVALSVEPALTLWYVSLNMKDPVLGKNKYLRQAIASTVDRALWLKLFKNSRGQVQDEVSPPMIPDRCGKPYRWSYDPVRAKNLLAKAGFPEGKGLPVLRMETQGAALADRQLAELMVRNLNEVGIRSEIVVNTFPAYLEKCVKGNLQLSKGSWVADFPDAENFYQLLYGPNHSPGPNEANFDHPEFNQLYKRVSALRPGEQRRKLICRMEEIIQDEVPWAYGVFEDGYRLVQPWLKNYRTADLIQNKYKYVDVERSASRGLAVSMNR